MYSDRPRFFQAAIIWIILKVFLDTRMVVDSSLGSFFFDVIIIETPFFAVSTINLQKKTACLQVFFNIYVINGKIFLKMGLQSAFSVCRFGYVVTK